MTKYIFVTGGVVSSLGKGITASSIGRLLKNRGLKVTMQKFDPYINIDPGTMNPYQHGEVFVTDDGTEADLDLGHYERLVDVRTSKYSNVTTGKIYQEVLQRERRGHARIVNQQIAGQLASGLDIAIFPEGTTTDGTCLLPFHGALLQPAIDSACPIQPASLAYFDEHGRRCPAPAYAGQTTLAESVSAIIACRSLTVRLRTTPSIMPEASQTRRGLACMAHGAIAYSLGLGTEFMDDAPMPGPLPWADRTGSRETPLEGSA